MSLWVEVAATHSFGDLTVPLRERKLVERGYVPVVTDASLSVSICRLAIEWQSVAWYLIAAVECYVPPSPHLVLSTFLHDPPPPFPPF